MKKITILLLVLIFSFGSLFATGAAEAQTTVEEQKPEGTVEVVWWTNLGKANVSYLQTIIDAFNESQSDYHVTIEYQGGNNELIAKMQSTNKEGLPAMFHGSIENIGMYMTADYCKPLQYFLDQDEEGWPELENTYASVYNASCDGEGNLIGYPTGYSYPTIYYNKDMFKAAGIDPASLASLPGVLAACRTLVNGGYCKYGIGFHNSAGYYLSASIAREGVIAFDNRDGLDGEITKCLYQDGGEAQAAITNYLMFYKDLYAENLAVPFGANYSSEIIPLIASNDCAMLFGVISMTTKLLTAVDGKFEVGIVPCPSVTENGKREGEPSGGTWVFVCDNGNKWQMQGAYEFIKFASKGEWAGYFASKTGYLAPSSDAYNSEVYQNYLTNIFPGVMTAYESLAACKGLALMPLSSVSSSIKDAGKVAVETVCNNPTEETVYAAVKTAYEQMQDALDLANMNI